MSFLRDGDIFNGVLKISGISCAVMANFGNGVITIKLSTAVKLERFFYELRPMVNGKNDIAGEVSRLSFHAAVNKDTGKVELKLFHRPDIRENLNFVIKVRGYPKKDYCNLKFIREGTDNLHCFL